MHVAKFLVEPGILNVDGFRVLRHDEHEFRHYFMDEAKVRDYLGKIR